MAGRIAACPHCGRNNRIPWARAGQSAKCGACKREVVAAGAPIDLAEGELEAIVAESPRPVLVDFWAPWCGPCRIAAPEVAKLASTANDRFVVAKLDTERAQNTAARLGIRSIPTFAVFVGGREVGRIHGARRAAELEQFVNQSIAKQYSRPAPPT
ncbi:MAG TPA: thioredoxin [Nannocystaceae bacterium]|nr:thioredoxin [Nannocystaceae bacterium]